MSHRFCCCNTNEVPAPPTTHCRFCSGEQIHHVIVSVNYTPCPARSCTILVGPCGLLAASQEFPGAANGTHLLPSVVGETGVNSCRYCKPIVLASAVPRGITSGCAATSDAGCGTGVNGTMGCGNSIAWADVFVSPGSLQVSVSDYSVTRSGYRCPDGSCTGVCTQVYTRTLAGFSLTSPEFTAFCNGSTITRQFNMGTCNTTNCNDPPGLFSAVFGSGMLTVTVTRG